MNLVKEMKNKYQRMSKEEKKQCQTFYYNTEKGHEMKMRFLRLKIIGGVGVAFSIFLVVSGYISNEINWATWVMAGILFLFSWVFIIGSEVIKGKCLNQYAVKKMK